MCNAYKCNFCTGSEYAHRQNYNVKMSAILPDPIGKGENIRQMTAQHKWFATAPHMGVKALQKVYEMWVKISVRVWRMLVRGLESTSIYTCCGWCTSESTITNNNYYSPIDTKYKYVYVYVTILKFSHYLPTCP